MSRLTDLIAQAKAKDTALAAYADANASVFRRIEAVAEIDGNFRMLDLTQGKVRDAIAQAASAKSAYAGVFGVDYPQS